MANMKDENGIDPSNQNKVAAAKVLDFDTILKKEVGHFGWFQVRNIVLAFIAVIFLGWSNSAYIFTAARIPNRLVR